MWAVALKDSPQRWWLMLLLVSGMIFCYAQRGALPVAAPWIMKEFELSKSQMGILLSAFFWSYSVMQMPAGWMVDRFGVKQAYAIGYAFWSVASTLTGFAYNLVTLIALRVLLGIGQAVAFPASARAVANWFQEKERGVVTASYLAGVRLGQALVAAAGGVIPALYDLRFFFLIIGVVPMVWLLPWTEFLKKWEGRSNVESPLAYARGSDLGNTAARGLDLGNTETTEHSARRARQQPQPHHDGCYRKRLLPAVPFVSVVVKAFFTTKDTADTTGTNRLSRAKFSLLQSLALARDRTVMGIFLGFFAYDYAWFMYFNWLPTYLIRERKFSAREMGIYSSIPYVAMSIIILVSGALSDWLIRRDSELRVPRRRALQLESEPQWRVCRQPR